MKKIPFKFGISLGALFVIAFAGLMWFLGCRPSVLANNASNETHLVAIHDRDIDKKIVTKATTIAEALKEAGITLDDRDTVEPSRDEQLTAESYQVNIYRARPVIVVDDNTRQKIMTPYQTAEQIASDAGIVIHDGDLAKVERSEELADGAGLMLIITRATPVTFNLYGKTFTARTMAKTVGEMLEEKGVTLTRDDLVSPSVYTLITEGMTIKVWREGRQTVTVDEPVDFPVERIYDTSKPIGYKAIKTAGVLGSRTVVYDIVTINGEEASRTEVNSVVTKKPQTQTEIIGVEPGDGLTKNKGVNFFTDSSGVAHRETYYDLPMNVVVGFCGGSYVVRSDGAKVDQDGYVLVAADLSRYPRCSIVETSLGLGKVYDTGGFVARYPDGFDLATDWTNGNGV